MLMIPRRGVTCGTILERHACRVGVGKPERDLVVDGRIVISRHARIYGEIIWTGFM
jgi:hypothetical protein